VLDESSPIHNAYFKDASIRLDFDRNFSIIKFETTDKNTGKAKKYQYILRTNDIVAKIDVVNGS
jgi:intein-encoded DNA endonuclease-like protein